MNPSSALRGLDHDHDRALDLARGHYLLFLLCSIESSLNDGHSLSQIVSRPPNLRLLTHRSRDAIVNRVNILATRLLTTRLKVVLPPPL